MNNMLSFLFLYYSEVVDLPKWSCVCGHGYLVGHSCHDMMASHAEMEVVDLTPPVNKRVAELRRLA